jgi:hypothetical protein
MVTTTCERRAGTCTVMHEDARFGRDASCVDVVAEATTPRRRGVVSLLTTFLRRSVRDRAGAAPTSVSSCHRHILTRVGPRHPRETNPIEPIAKPRFGAAGREMRHRRERAGDETNPFDSLRSLMAGQLPGDCCPLVKDWYNLPPLELARSRCAPTEPVPAGKRGPPRCPPPERSRR